MKTFTWRLTLWFTILVTGTTAVLLAVGGALLHQQLLRSTEVLHTIEGEELLGLLAKRENLTEADIAHIIETEADSDAALFFIQVHHENGRVLFRSGNLEGAILPSPVREQSHWTVELPAFGPVRVSEFRRGPWHIQVASRLSPLWRVRRDYARVSAFLILGSAVVGLALGFGFSRLTLQPVRVIEQTARRIGADNLSERIRVPDANDELFALARLLNQMFDRLETAFGQVQQFTANASHELKTPLSLIRLNADKLRPRVSTDPEAARAVDEMSEEIRRLQQIIESLLFLSKAEGGGLALQRRRLQLPDWLDQFAEDARALAEDRHAHFALTRNDPGELEGEPHLLRHLLLNLVNNALTVAPTGSAITLESCRRDGEWRWVISDEGPGLPGPDLERVFGRFVRVGAREDGHGLGLAICRSIAALHGGRIWAENRTDRTGLRVITLLPALPTSAP